MARNRRLSKGFTLVEIMIVVLIIGILLAIAVPNFINARTQSRAQTCIANLKQIDSAKQQYAMAQGLTTGAAVTVGNLVPTYMNAAPSGPIPSAGGDANGYAASAVGTDPTFNTLNATTIAADCAPGGAGCPF